MAVKSSKAPVGKRDYVTRCHRQKSKSSHMGRKSSEEQKMARDTETCKFWIYVECLWRYRCKSIKNNAASLQNSNCKSRLFLNNTHFISSCCHADPETDDALCSKAPRGETINSLITASRQKNRSNMSEISRSGRPLLLCFFVCFVLWRFSEPSGVWSFISGDCMRAYRRQEKDVLQIVAVVWILMVALIKSQHCFIFFVCLFVFGRVGAVIGWWISPQLWAPLVPPQAAVRGRWLMT